MHILIADDDPGTRLTVCAAVERLGHRCTVTEDGESALRAYQADPPDAVITDWQMPGMDGTALVQAIRGQGDGNYAYVMVLTGEADEESARATMEAGADDLLLKPLEPAQLERKLIAAERVTTMHRRMHEDARHDAATGLANRLRLAEDLEVLCGRVARYEHVYCVAVFDVDNFKGVNDAAGHLYGDQTLRQIASALQREVRSGDAVYRYGGEEFLVLLPEQSLESATLAAERLRTAVEGLAIPHPAGGVVTVSAGVAGLNDPQCHPDEVFELADQALYRAKEADQAIELAARRRPDIVLLDFNMPGGGGVRAATEIREGSPSIKLVAVS